MEWFFLVGIIVMIISMAAFTDREYGAGTVLALIAVVFFGVAASEAYDLGRGRVSIKTEEFGKRLDSGVAYQIILSAVADGGKNQILFLKRPDTEDFYAIRVEGATPPPEFFTLVGGKPVPILVEKPKQPEQPVQK